MRTLEIATPRRERFGCRRRACPFPSPDMCDEVSVPTGSVKWFDTEKGFGFLSRDDGGDVFVHKGALPAGVEALKPGERVEFGVAEGRRGEQALSVHVLTP